MTSYFFLMNKLSGDTISIAGMSSAAGATLLSWPQKQTGNNDQLWGYVPDPAGSGYFFIETLLDGNAISIAGMSTAPGADLVSWPQKQSGYDDQLWQFVPDPLGSGYFFIKTKLNGNVISIAGMSTAPGANLVSWPQKQSGYDDQLWKIVSGAPVSVAPQAPVIDSINPSEASPGNLIVLNGKNFGAQQGTGYVLFADNGVNWGQPGDVAPFSIQNWSDMQIGFLVPVKGQSSYQVTPGTTASVSVTNSNGLTSNTVELALCSAVRWPLNIDSGQTQIGKTGNGFMDTTVTIDQAGNLTANTKVWDTSGWGPFTGFHGATVVCLYDTFGNLLDTFPAGPFGVEGGQTNENPWSATVPAEKLCELYSVAVVNFYDPQYTVPGEILNWAIANAPAIAAAAKAVAAAL
ncbi:RICIN domain-containing protein [Ferrovum sp.]|uniref:RICIN domain-containing protein n=1 Tax=Ferrovum sp. TaxID=2609467 RepID=UPI002623B8D2|nr:RICIN domain-containing protein [Ferrovum sp.]